MHEHAKIWAGTSQQRAPITAREPRTRTAKKKKVMFFPALRVKHIDLNEGGSSGLLKNLT